MASERTSERATGGERQARDTNAATLPPQKLGRESKAKKKTAYKGMALTEWEDARGIRGQASGKGVASERRASGPHAASGGRWTSEWRAGAAEGASELRAR